MSWFADQSRYTAGYECPWRRLIRYHMLGTGLTFEHTPEEIVRGSSIHGDIEEIYKAVQQGIEVGKGFLIRPPQPQDALVVGLVEAYSRIVVPWVRENFQIIAAEEEYTHNLGDDIIWMARPDLTLRDKVTGKMVVADYKSSSSKPDKIAQIHIASLQTIMNGWGISVRHGELGAAQIHILNAGSPDYPSFLTHAYYRVAQPPYYSEDWQPKGKDIHGKWLGKLYKKVEVSKFRPVSDWVWAMNPEQLSEAVPVLSQPIDPTIQAEKVFQAVASIKENEKWWRAKTESINWDQTTLSDLDLQFPRTFKCVQYNRTCEYTGICFKRKQLGLEKPTDLIQISQMGDITGMFPMVRREPHHPQEGNLED